MKDGMVSSQNLHPKEEVGCRVESVGFFGTVRYIGSLPDHPGKWYGIEWDDPSRGKHNGNVNGVQYFTTQHPTSGSFVRREKINFGKSIIEAIMTHYGKEQSEIMKKFHEREISNLKKIINAPFIEFVGFDKVSTQQNHFDSLKIVDVSGHCVSSIDENNELRSLLPNIQQLDISRNLLTSWADIFKICSQLDHLFWLNVSGNLLEFPEKCLYTFPNITVFICGNMNLTWVDIQKLSSIFPNINELRAINNNISDLTTEEKNNFRNLEILDLENNPIRKWDEVMKLSNIRSLQNLSIGGIGLEKIDFRTDSPKVDCFENLTKLCISGNNINDWTSVSELNKLKSLDELRFINNPILNVEDVDTTIALVVAKIGNLKVYNGRRLVGEFRMGSEFRRGCEYDYLKRYGLEWLRVKDTPNRTAFLKEHNRYVELVNMYGELELAELKVQDTTKLTSTLISLNLLHRDKTITKKIAPSMVVQKLKILVQKLFKLDKEPALVCQTDDGFEIPLDDETKELSYFSVTNNDTILVKI